MVVGGSGWGFGGVCHSGGFIRLDAGEFIRIYVAF